MCEEKVKIKEILSGEGREEGETERRKEEEDEEERKKEKDNSQPLCHATIQ